MVSKDQEVKARAPRPSHALLEKTSPGYKWTEVGVIPIDWYVFTVGELFEFLRTASNSRADLGDSGVVAYVHYGDLHTRFNHFIDFSRDNVPRLLAGESVTAARLLDGDLIVADASEDEAGVGKSVEVRNLGTTEAVSGLHTFLLRSKNRRVHDGYRGYLLENEPVKGQLRSLATGLKVFGISKQALRDVRIPLPSPAEQRAIAEALSDVDGMLATLEALIAKKRAIKQAAMQQLLTGKTRLPGFSGEWQTTSISRIGSTYGGLSGKRKADFGGGDARYVTFLGVLENVILDASHTEHVRVALGESQNSVLKGDLLFNGTSETHGDLAMGAVMRQQIDNLYLNSFCFGFRIRHPSLYYSMFLAYLFRGPIGRTIMKALSQGATRYNMSKGKFLALELAIPAYEEQTAVAAVLSDMDAEIAAVECRRDKTHTIKQGVMQQLLTGRVRLIESESSWR